MKYGAPEEFRRELSSLSPQDAKVDEFLAALASRTFEELKEMDFDPLDLRFGEYETRPKEEIPFETHKKHWDLQIVLEGEELLSYTSAETVSQTTPYDEANDITFYKGDTDKFVKLHRGAAVLLAPCDAHRPGEQAENGAAKIKKIVVKLPCAKSAE